MDGLAHTTDGVAWYGGLEGCGDRYFPRSIPVVLKILASMIPLLVEDFVEFRRVRSLIQYLSRGTRLCPVLIRSARDFLSRSRDISEVSHPWIVGGSKVDHWKRTKAGRHASKPGRD